jgi:hypothetical protein
MASDPATCCSRKPGFVVTFPPLTVRDDLERKRRGLAGRFSLFGFAFFCVNERV